MRGAHPFRTTFHHDGGPGIDAKLHVTKQGYYEQRHVQTRLTQQ